MTNKQLAMDPTPKAPVASIAKGASGQAADRNPGRTASFAALALAFLLASMLVFLGCSHGEGINDTSEGTAATLNGEAIGEKAVNAYIADFRQSLNLEDDEAWADWLQASGRTPESVRNDAIEALIQTRLFEIYAAEHDITVEQSDIDAALARAKSTYENNAQWTAALEEAGLTEETYVETVLRPGLLEQKVREDAVPETIGSDEAVLASLQDAAGTLEGAKRSSHILFSAQNEEEAEQVLAEIRAGSLTFEDAVGLYSTDAASASQGGDVGWDVGTGFVSEYQEALDGLEKGDVSDPVASTYGIHLILCTDVYEVPAGGIESLDDVPAEIVALFRQSLSQASDDQAYYQWYRDYRNGAEVEINPLPEKAPYNVSLGD